MLHACITIVCEVNYNYLIKVLINAKNNQVLKKKKKFAT